MKSPTQKSDAEMTKRSTILGQWLFGVGVLLIVLRALPLATGMPGLPPFWYQNQSMWIAIGFGLTVLGWQFLWGRLASQPPKWRPAVSGVRFRTATMYVGRDCHLCDEASELLTDYRNWLPAIDLVQIDSDPSLVTRFSTCTPVLVLDGKVRFRGRISEPLLRRLIEGTAPLRSTL